MPRGWENNVGLSVALAMHHGLSRLSPYRLKGQRMGDERPTYAACEVWHHYFTKSASGQI